MFKAIGFVIALYAISILMHEAFVSFERAVAATFQTVEVAAVVSKHQLIDMSR